MGAILDFHPQGTPWQPNSHTQLVDVYKKWEYPLAGVFELEDIGRWGFMRLAGVLEPLTFWAVFLVDEGWSLLLKEMGDDPITWLDDVHINSEVVHLLAFDENKGITAHQEIVRGLVRPTLLELIEAFASEADRASYLEDAGLSVAG